MRYVFGVTYQKCIFEAYQESIKYIPKVFEHTKYIAVMSTFFGGKHILKVYVVVSW